MEEKKTNSSLFLVISVIYVVCLLLSNVIAGKLWHLFGNVVLPASVILFPVTYILADVFTEVYGFNKARIVIWLGFGASFFAAAIYLATIALRPPEGFGSQEAYELVLGTTPRIALASFVAYLFGEFSNSMVLSKLKVATKGKKLWVRTILSTLVGEGLDSAIFIAISFAGTMDLGALFRMMLFQYLFKVLYEAVFTPLTYLIIRWVKKKEGVDIYDYDVRYKVFGGGK